MDIRKRLYVATMAQDAVMIAEQYQLGLEVDEFCTASNMEGKDFQPLNRSVNEMLKHPNRFVLHAPFNELFPCAIDPLALQLAYHRYNQAFELAKQYGIHRMVVHSGYVPYVYFKSWFLERSEEFWKTFMKDKPENFHIMIENVLEDEPHTLAALIERIDDQRVKACLDIGHANCSSSLDLTEWIKVLGPWLSHTHIHNNRKEYDSHDPLGKGDIDMNRILSDLERYAPADITFTVENLKSEESLTWLEDNEWIESYKR